MATVTPVGYNPSQSSISGTTQIGSLAVGATSLDWSSKPGGITYWMSPDQDYGYVVSNPVPSGNQPTRPAIGATAAYVGFSRSSTLTDSSFVTMVNFIAAGATSFTDTQGTQAKSWLNTNGYWTSYLGIVTDGLIIQLDADNTSSYPGTGTTVYDITGSYNHTLTSAPYTVLNGVKCFDCNGATTKIEVNGSGPTLPTSGYTYITWARVKTSSADYRTLFRTTPDDHPILVQSGNDNLGFYDNGGGGFIDSGYDVTSIEDVWVQYTVVGDNSSSSFYINGAQVGTTIAYGAGGNAHYQWGGHGGQPFGYVANMYYYNRKLSLSEITQQYTFLAPRFITPSPSQTNLIMSWDIQQSSSYSGSGTTITDLKGNSNGTLTGTIGYTSGKPAYLTVEGGASEYIVSATSLNSKLSPANTGTSISVFVWAYPTENGIIVAELGTTTPNSGWHDAQIEMVSGTIKFGVWNGSGISSVTSTIATPLNNWYYLGFTYNGTTLTGYVNGRSAGSTAVSRQTPYNQGSTGLHYGLGPNDITNMGDGTGMTFRFGAMQVYNTGLSADSVLANYNATKFSYVL